MNIHQLTAADAVASLQSSSTGLSHADAERRFQEFGPNRVEELAREPVALHFIREFTQFFSVILWLAAGLAFFAEWSAPSQAKAIVFATGQAIDVAFWEDFIFAIGIIVAMVPEGLQPTLTLALVLAVQRMAKRHLLIRHLSSVETLGSTTVICTDKTGALTQNRMTVRRLFLGNTSIWQLWSNDGTSLGTATGLFPSPPTYAMISRQFC